MAELGIVDIREIIRIIKKVHDYDFSNYALTSFKYNLERVIALNGLTNAENLFRKLSEDNEFFDTFLHDLHSPSTEMFRDPAVWRFLREEYFPGLNGRQLDNFKIWLPYCVSGAELFTLCILLEEIGILDKVRIFATVFSNKSLSYIKSGKYPLKKIETSVENYKRFQGQKNLENYFVIDHNEAIRSSSLIKDVEFIKDDIIFSKAPQNLKFILFRNTMIYYNPTRQAQTLELMHKNLSASGSLVVGIKESIKLSNVNTPIFDAFNENEGIYKKRF